MEVDQRLWRPTSHGITIIAGRRSVLEVSADALGDTVSAHLPHSDGISDSRYRPGRGYQFTSLDAQKSTVSLTWDDIRQGPQRGLNLANRACILGDKVLIDRKPFGRLEKRRRYWILDISDGFHVCAPKR